MKISEAFDNITLTENGDLAYISTGNPMVDLIFFAPFLNKNLDKADEFINKIDKEILPLFAGFVRDPRYGLGYKDLGRKMLKMANVSPDFIAKVGRYDDLWKIGSKANLDYLYNQIKEGNELAKKWMPRFGSKNKIIASKIAKYYGLNKQNYGKFIKVDTVERLLTEKRTDEINFEHVPSLAAIKYAKRFFTGSDTVERYTEYKNKVKNGEAKLNVSTTTPYDIFLNRHKIDPDMFFEKLEKISISCMPVVDTSGSMGGDKDAFGKAIAIGHYLAMCSSYENGKVVSFSSRPKILDLNDESFVLPKFYNSLDIKNTNSKYLKQIARMYTGECSNTDFGAVMRLLEQVNELPEYLVVLSDMQFDNGSYMSKTALQKLWKEKGYTTKIIWWNFNDRGMTTPETDNMGNIFMSSYSPMLLKYLETGFDANKFIKKLLGEYANIILNSAK